MLKKVILIIMLLLVCACTEKNIEKFYLSNEYYDVSGFISIDENDINYLSDKNYILFTYNNYCNLSTPCEEIFEEFMVSKNISFLSIPFEDFKKTSFYSTVKYAPSIIIIKEGKIVAYLDANSDDDLNKYQEVNSFSEWINQYIYLKI